MIDWTKPIRRVNTNRPARLICRDRVQCDGSTCYVVLGCWIEGPEEGVSYCTDEGKSCYNGVQMFENVPPERISTFRRIYRDGSTSTSIFIALENAKLKAHGVTPVGVIEVVREDGLTVDVILHKL